MPCRSDLPRADVLLLPQVGLPKGRGCLLLGEMSSQGTLAQGDYTNKTVEMAKARPDFVRHPPPSSLSLSRRSSAPPPRILPLERRAVWRAARWRAWRDRG